MDIVLANVLMDMYARCGCLTKAHQFLEELPIRDVIAWNALITGYVQEGQNHEALNCFGSMQSEGIYPNAATFGFFIGSTLVDMYAKCGLVSDV